MAKSNPSSLLDIDESLLHRNLLINKDEEEFQQLFSAAMAGKNQQETRHLPYKTVTPKPGFCVKARQAATGQKVFINVCHTDVLPQPENVTEEELAQILESDEPSTFRVPMSLGAGHEEVDKSGGNCIVYDVAVNSAFLERVESSELFRTFLIVAAMEGLEDKYNVELDKNSWTVLRNRKHLGTIQSHRIEQRDEKPLVREVPKLSQIGKEPVKPLIAEVQTKSFSLADNQQHYVFQLGKSLDGKEFIKADFYVKNLLPKDAALLIGEREIRFTYKREKLDYNLGLPYAVDSKHSKAVCNILRNCVTVIAPILA